MGLVYFDGNVNSKMRSNDSIAYRIGFAGIHFRTIEALFQIIFVDH